MPARKKPERVRFGEAQHKPFRPLPPPSPRRSGSAGTVALVLFVALLVGAVAAKAWEYRNRPAPNYLAALELIEDYETGRSPEERNYSDPLYERALEELAQVEPDSVSAEPAEQLEAEIRSSIEQFVQARQAREAQFAQNRERARQRRAALARSHIQGQLNPVRAEDDCEDE